MAKKAVTPIHQTGLYFGCDPEFFVATSKGKIVNAETVTITKDKRVEGTTKVFSDGVAMEINPSHHTCREHLATAIQECLRMVRSELNKKKDEKLQIIIGSTVPIDLGILEGASENAVKFLCEPSHSAYSDVKDKVTVDASKHKKRYGGGHIHLGLTGYDDSGGRLANAFKNQPNELAMAMDILVGNMSVLLDRDPLSAERRKLYGKPGEYRRPKPLGNRIEYRVLSNFWLKSPVYMYFVMGCARAACNIVGHGMHEELFKIVDFDKIQKAILTNDFALAWKNAQPVLEWVPPHFHESEGYLYPLRSRATQEVFKWLITFGDKALIETRKDLVTRWGGGYGTYRGWENLCKDLRSGARDAELPKDMQFKNWSPTLLEAKIKEESHGSRAHLS